MPPIEVDTEITRRNNGNFPVTDDRNIRGSLHVVPDLATRDSIPTNLLKAGMLCRVQDQGATPGTVFELITISPLVWGVFSTGGGGGALPPFVGALKFLRTNATNNAAEWVTLTLDMIAAAFAITSFSPTFSTTLEIGQSLVNPGFTASYNRTPTLAELSDGGPFVNITSSPTAFAYGTPPLGAITYTEPVINFLRTWTLRAQETGSPLVSTTVTAAWRARNHFGIAPIPGSYNAAFITGLATTNLVPGFSGVYAFPAPGGVNKLYLTWPTAFGNPSLFKNNDTGFAIPFTKVATGVSVTNVFSVVTPYDIWESDFFLVSAVNVAVS